MLIIIPPLRTLRLCVRKFFMKEKSFTRRHGGAEKYDMDINMNANYPSSAALRENNSL